MEEDRKLHPDETAAYLYFRLTMLPTNRNPVVESWKRRVETGLWQQHVVSRAIRQLIL